MRFLDSLTLPASILTDFQRFSLILDRFRQLLKIFSKSHLQNLMGQSQGPMGIRLQFLDPTLRVNVAEPRRLRIKYNLSELIRRFPGNGPNQTGAALGSARAGGKDDGGLQKLPKTKIPTYSYNPL